MRASCVLKEMSAALIKLGEVEGSIEQRREFVQACTAVTIKQVYLFFFERHSVFNDPT